MLAEGIPRTSQNICGHYIKLCSRTNSPSPNFWVRSVAVSRCPHCRHPLRVIGSRPRTRRTPDGVRQILIIRRLRCDDCQRIHHELPDCLVPFRRYDSDSLEAFGSQGTTAAVAAEPSTFTRWQAWLRVWIPYVQRCWMAMAARQRIGETGEALPFLAPLPPRAPWVADTTPAGWLASIVHRMVNDAFWLQTRSASVT